MTEPGEAVVAAFAEVFGVQGKRFGSKASGIRGASDGHEGVQWNAWFDAKADLAYLGVNLEGKQNDGWPIARFIERELDESKVMQLAPVPDVEVCWMRDAWTPTGIRVPIAESHIGGTPLRLASLTPDRWKDMLTEAYACLNTDKGHRGRGRQEVTLAKKGRQEMQVSPHLHFGDVPSVPVGATCENWRQLADAGVHRAMQAGISGSAEEGADSVAVAKMTKIWARSWRSHPDYGG